MGTLQYNYARVFDTFINDIAFDRGPFSSLYPVYNVKQAMDVRIAIRVALSVVDIGGMCRTFATSSGCTVSQF